MDADSHVRAVGAPEGVFQTLHAATADVEQVIAMDDVTALLRTLLGMPADPDADGNLAAFGKALR